MARSLSCPSASVHGLDGPWVTEADGRPSPGEGLRLAQAADRERRRIAQDLHDGLQTRLVLLALEADRVCGELGSATAIRDQVAGLRAGLEQAIAELRTFVDGVMPAALTERGLCAAVQGLTDRVPIPVQLSLDPWAGRLPPAVESTGYFVISEAVTNAVKHSGADELGVSVGLADGRLRIEVRDNGIGGARTDGAGGIRGIGDRVGALAGRLLVHSPPGGGTRVIAEVPCPARAAELDSRIGENHD
jgi:signal transduction histidine kinase